MRWEAQSDAGAASWVTEAPDERPRGQVGPGGELRFRNGGVGLGKPRSRVHQQVPGPGWRAWISAKVGPGSPRRGPACWSPQGRVRAKRRGRAQETPRAFTDALRSPTPERPLVPCSGFRVSTRDQAPAGRPRVRTNADADVHGERGLGGILFTVGGTAVPTPATASVGLGGVAQKEISQPPGDALGVTPSPEVS